MNGWVGQVSGEWDEWQKNERRTESFHHGQRPAIDQRDRSVLKI